MTHLDPTILLMNSNTEANAIEKRSRGYLGMSEIGEACYQKLWLSFRFCSPRLPAADSVYRMDDGNYSEHVTSKRLNAVSGISLLTHDREGKQIGFTDLGGHYRGHADGMIQGLSHDHKTPHVWEHKCTNQSNFNKIKKLLDNGCADPLLTWNETYYAQAQEYMHYSETPKHYLTIALAGSREYTAFVTNKDENYHSTLRAKAHHIITSIEGTEKISDNKDFFKCGYCDHKDLCHGDAIPQVTCRSCVHSKPTNEGTWRCNKYGHTLTIPIQVEACADHCFIPKLLSTWAELVEFDTDVGFRYLNKTNDKMFWNSFKDGGEYYSSKELLASPSREFIGDDVMTQLKSDFGGTFNDG
jgi:hypothetical protein